jgi:hypothetical protein
MWMGDLQVIGGLRDKRSELIELVGCLEQQLADHRVSLTHLDATMRLFDPDLRLADTDLQQRERVSWFRPGECLRTIYDVMREAPQPLTTRDVARRVIAAKGISIADDRTQSLIQKTILASLSRAKNTLDRLEVDGVVSWRVRQAA